MTRTATELLDALLERAPALDASEPSALLDAMERDERSFSSRLDRALLWAARVDRLGLAFTAGYTAATGALSEILGGAPAGARISLAATEEGGAHPRAIKTTFVPDGDGGTLDGAKAWCTLAFEATHLLVIANAGEREGRPLLKAISIPRARDGVHLEAMPETPFCPEVRHASIALRAVRVEPAEVAPCDGFADVLKPFRTIEDLCVQAALLAWLTGTGMRHGFDRALVGRCVALLLAVRELWQLPPSARSTHVALGGLLAESVELVAALDPAWHSAPAPERERFERDRALLGIASRVRAERLRVAWEAF